MTARVEALLVVCGAFIAGAGTAIVTATVGDPQPLDPLAAGGVHLAAFGGMLLAQRRWSPAASRFLLPLVSLIAAVGSIEVFRIDAEAKRGNSQPRGTVLDVEQGSAANGRNIPREAAKPREMPGNNKEWQKSASHSPFGRLPQPHHANTTGRSLIERRPGAPQKPSLRAYHNV